jgi:plastocyanin
MISFGLFGIGMVAGCGDDGGTKMADAPPAAVSNIDVVTCMGGEMGPITADGAGTTADPFKFDPNALTIAVGDTVEFMMPSIHNVVPDTGGDSGLKVNFSETKCLKFKAAGDYSFHCGPHGFKGTITVQ